MLLKLKWLKVFLFASLLAALQTADATADQEHGAVAGSRAAADLLYLKGDFANAAAAYDHLLKEQNGGDAELLLFQADAHLKAAQYQESCRLYCRAREKTEPASSFYFDSVLGESVCHCLSGHADTAEKILDSNLTEAYICKLNAYDKARLEFLRASIYYSQTRYSEALCKFEQCISGLKGDSIEELKLAKRASFGAGGAAYHLKCWTQAVDFFKSVLKLDQRLFGNSDLQTGWMHLALSDLYTRLSKEQQAAEEQKLACWIFRSLNEKRITRELLKDLPESDLAGRQKLADKVHSYIFGNAEVPVCFQESGAALLPGANAMLSDRDPISALVKPFVDAPGKIWLNPRVDRKALLVCIHGLSLQHSAFDALAKKLADKGYICVAFDMRGFGVYQQALGAELVDFDGCMQDLSGLVGELKRSNPELPVFILGESMGGAIGLRFASLHPELCDGLIASVPAGKRFKSGSTALKVALKFLENKNRPFNIGEDVVNQATSDPELKAEWTLDPMTRSDLSPVELLRFAKMLKSNLEYARKLKTPVIIYQGVHDRLVKPEATYELFNAIGSPDKSLVMVGNAEHLIFEEGQFQPAVLFGLIGWLDAHLSSCPEGFAKDQTEI